MSDSDLTYGIQITADGKVAVAAVGEVRHEVEQLGTASKKVADDINVITQAQVNANYAAQKAAEQYRFQGEALGVASVQVQKLLDRYDPLGTKLRSLESDFAMLNKATKGGEIGSSSDAAVDKTYAALNAEIAKTQGLMQAAGVAGSEGFAAMSGGAIESAFSTAQARRELIVLGHEAMTGNFSRMPGSFMVLAERIGLSGGALGSVLLPIAAVAGAAIGLAVAIAKGHAEMLEMNNALAITNSYAGLTRGGMIQLAEATAATGEVTIGSAKGIVMQLVASGRIGAESIGAVARLASDYAHATGHDIDKIAPQLVKLFSDPLNGAEELNKSMHFLTVADLDYIATLDRLGQTQEAQLFLAQKVTAHNPIHAASVGLLEKSYRNWVNTLSDLVNNLKAIGAGSVTESLLKSNETELNLLQMYNDPKNQPRIDLLQKQHALLMDQYVVEQKKLSTQVKQTEELDKQLKAHDSIKNSTTARIQALRDELSGVSADKASNPVDRARRELELNKQIVDLQRGMGAEGRALSTERIDAGLRYWELDKKGYEDTITFLQKIGELTSVEANARRLKLEQDDLDKRIIAETAKLRVGGTPQQQLAIRDTVTGLEIQKANLPGQYARKDAEDLYKEEEKLNAIMGKGASESEAHDAKAVKSLTDELAKLKEHNAEIGKTKDQIDALRASQIDLKIVKDQDAIDTATANMDGSQMDANHIASMQKQIDIEKQLRDEHQQAAGLDKIAEDTKKATTEARTFGLTMESALGRMITGTMKGGDVVKALGQDIAQLIAKITILQPMEKALEKAYTSNVGSGGVMGALGNMLGFGGASNIAYGSTSYADAFASGAIPMAAGGDFTVTKPTLFLAGEAGPERATFSGANNAGATSGGGGAIVLNFNTDARGADAGAVARIQASLVQFKRDVVPQVVDAVRRGGSARSYLRS